MQQAARATNGTAEEYNPFAAQPPRTTTTQPAPAPFAAAPAAAPRPVRSRTFKFKVLYEDLVTGKKGDVVL